MTPREIVRYCLTFQSPPRIPRHLWALPWAHARYPDILASLEEKYPGDFGKPGQVYRPSSRENGNPYKIGTYTDPWGCVFENIQEGIIGEVKAPLIREIADWRHVRPPYEVLPDNQLAAKEQVNRACGESDKFVIAGCCPRSWEQYQFLRGTVNAMVDVLMPEMGMSRLLKKMQDFYMKELEFWVTTDVDAVSFMDDWGSQGQLLIDPGIWRDLFKPLYKQYCDLAAAHGKFVFMHSDGNILSIYPDLIEIGVSAINSQLFCMDMKELARVAKGRITFWGEIDRQHVLPSDNPRDGRDAVRTVARHLYSPEGGIIAQIEFGPGANPRMPETVFEEWEAVAAGR